MKCHKFSQPGESLSDGGTREILWEGKHCPGLRGHADNVSFETSANAFIGLCLIGVSSPNVSGTECIISLLNLSLVLSSSFQ